MARLVELQGLYKDTFVQEVMKRTLNTSLTWTQPADDQFLATRGTWTYTVTRTATGNITASYRFQVKKAGSNYISFDENAIPYTDRDSNVKELYDTLDIIVNHTDLKYKDAISGIQ